MSLSKTADMQSIRRKGFRTSFGRPKIGLPSLRPKWRRTGSEPSAQSSGSIASTLRLRIDFFGRLTIVAARHNDRRVQIGGNDWP